MCDFPFLGCVPQCPPSFQFSKVLETLDFKEKIGATGFEPATSRPPAVHSNQTEPHPVVQLLFFIIQNFPKKVNALSNKKSGRVILITLPDFL